MLTAETKRRLDACRDILVGKLPLPTDQIELITLALIYKFMDDLDEESVRLGGKRSFFVPTSAAANSSYQPNWRIEVIIYPGTDTSSPAIRYTLPSPQNVPGCTAL